MTTREEFALLLRTIPRRVLTHGSGLGPLAVLAQWWVQGPEVIEPPRVWFRLLAFTAAFGIAFALVEVAEARRAQLP